MNLSGHPLSAPALLAGSLPSGVPLAGVPAGLNAVVPGAPVGMPALISGSVLPGVVQAGNMLVPTAWDATPVLAQPADGGMLAAIADAVAAVSAPAAAAGASAGNAVQETLPLARKTAANAGQVAATYAAAAGRSAQSAARTAKQKGSELWAGVRNPRSVHVTQVPSKYNRSPAVGNRDCGPASVVMALRMVGRKVPGVVASASPQRQIDRARELTGKLASTVSTTNWDLARALERAGAATREIFDLGSIRQAIRSGKPVILNGNPGASGAYGRRFSEKQMQPFDGSHWIVVSGFDEASGKFIVNDPLSKVGPVKVSASELEAYRGGSLGIEVDGH